MISTAVFGAGHIGCYVGGRLAAAGAPVTLIGRPGLLDTLATEGLVLSDHRGWQTRLAPSQLHLHTDAQAAAGAELVLVTVKSAATAAAGVSIITPTGMSARCGMPIVESSAASASISVLVCWTSSTETTSGSMIRRSPWTAARMSARSCGRNISGSSRHMRIARQPRNGFASVG